MKSNIDIICFPIVWNGILGYIVGTVLGVRSMMHSYFPNQFQALLLSSITASFAKKNIYIQTHLLVTAQQIVPSWTGEVNGTFVRACKCLFIRVTYGFRVCIETQ